MEAMSRPMDNERLEATIESARKVLAVALALVFLFGIIFDPPILEKLSGLVFILSMVVGLLLVSLDALILLPRMSRALGENWWEVFPAWINGLWIISLTVLVVGVLASASRVQDNPIWIAPLLFSMVFYLFGMSIRLGYFASLHPSGKRLRDTYYVYHPIILLIAFLTLLGLIFRVPLIP